MAEVDGCAGLARIPIAELNPSVDGNSVFVEGLVTLIWPYSVSKRSYSVLLADPDVRLRHHNGQVRIHFMGASAKAAAGCTIKYGDRISLKLQGVQWERDQAPSSTPGRSVEWELQFDQYVSLQVRFWWHIPGSAKSEGLDTTRISRANRSGC